MVDVQTIGVLVTAASVSVAAIYYAFTLRINMRNQELMLKAQETSTRTQELALKTQQQNLETRQAQLLIGIYQTLVSPEMMEASLKLQDIEMENVHDWNRLCKNKENYKA